jgi:hypothetical protein
MESSPMRCLSRFVASILLLVVSCAAVLAAEGMAQGWVDRTGPGGPAPRSGHAMCYDPARGYVLMVGQFLVAGGMAYQADAWSWDGSQWTARGPAPLLNVPSPSYPGSGYALAVHGATNEVFLAGCVGSVPNLASSSVWRWDGAAWTAVASGVEAASGTVLAMGYDPARQQTVLWSAFRPNLATVYDGVAWTTQTATSTPQGVSIFDHATMAFDPAVGRLVLALGQSQNARFFEWNGYGWNQRLPANVPPAGFAALATDTARGVVVGVDRDYLSLQPCHTWSYADGAPTRLPVAVEPTLRQATAMAFDPVRGVHVLFGGNNVMYTFGDTWELDLGPLASFTPQGTGCVGSRGVPQLAALGGSLPRVGQTFTTRTTNLPIGGPAFQLLGFSDVDYGGAPLPLDLTVLGASGCWLRTSIETAQPALNVFGNATWSIAIPPVLGVSFFVQTAMFDAAANELGLTFSNGGRAVVGL